MASGRPADNYLPLTAAVLYFVAAMQAAKKMYIAEAGLAEKLGTPNPGAWYDRCRALFFGTYASAARKAGLTLNVATFEAVMWAEISAEMNQMSFDDLPKQFAFLPWGAYGGIVPRNQLTA